MDLAGVDIYVLFVSVEVPCKFQNVFLSQTVKTVNFYTFPESRRMPTLFLQCYGVRRAPNLQLDTVKIMVKFHSFSNLLLPQGVAAVSCHYDVTTSGTLLQYK